MAIPSPPKGPHSSASCRRCSAPMRDDRMICVPCAEGIRDGTGKGALADLARYWDRRLMEGREKDWT